MCDETWRRYLERLIDRLKGTGAIRSERIEAAFRRVPRHRLVGPFYHMRDKRWHQVTFDPDAPSDGVLELLYGDNPIVTALAEVQEPPLEDRQRADRIFFDEKDTAPELGQTTNPVAPSSSSSQPSLVADMLRLLQLEPGMKVLEVGAGTGYNAALMAELVGGPEFITSVDIQGDVVAQTSERLRRMGYEHMKLVARDGFAGFAEGAPYDRIIATVGCPDISPHWIEQLHSDGFLLIPLLFGGRHPLVKIWREGSSVRGRFVGISGFMAIRGAMEVTGLWPYSKPVSFSFEGFTELPPLCARPAEIEAFGHFMILRDRRTITNVKPRVYALLDRARGVAGVCGRTGTILIKGDPALYDELDGLYREWCAAGKPNGFDYVMEFLPADANLDEESSWIIERRYFRQVFRLPPSLCR